MNSARFPAIVLTSSALTAGLLIAPVAVADAPAKPTSTVAASGTYGAIAIASDGAWGRSWNYRTKRKAGKWAMWECRRASDYPKTCKKVAWVRYGCLAVAVRWNGDFISRYGWATRSTKKKAHRAAKRRCGTGCVRRASVCSPH
ncbi:MAG: DUF4189 domain-containing protein [Candidatus Nanopelagicales bacterium]